MQIPENLSNKETVDWLLDRCWEMRLGNPKLALQFAQEAKQLSEQSNYLLGLGQSICFVAFFSFAQNQLGNAISLIDEAIAIFDSVPDEYNKSVAYVLRGGCYLQIGNYENGFEDMLKGLAYARKYNHSRAFATGSYLLGNYYIDGGNHALASQHYEDALATFQKMHDKTGVATAIAGMGNIAAAMQEHERALKHHYESLAISREINNPQVEARNLHDLGVVYENMGDYERALAYLNESLTIRQEKNILQGVVSCHISLGRIYAIKMDYDCAIKTLQKAIELAVEINAQPKLVKAYNVLADVYKRNQQPWEALETYEKYTALKSVTAGEESNAKLKTIQAIHETEIHRLRNIELKTAYEKIENQNQHIIDSIKYARRIQEALLPPQQELLQYADQAFIFYRPKDIVSGDFYWFAMKDGQTILACVDCTGHGVPGAFMVVMGISLLDEIVNEQGITEPTEILTRLDQKVRLALKQDQTESQNTQDGMDLAVVRFCNNVGKISFAGARSALYYVRDGEIHEVKSSMFPIGSSQYVGKKQYEQFEIDFLDNDMFYMSTDGYRDQFGGEENKKYTKPRFKKLLHSISALPTQTQHAYLTTEFDEWKRDYTQTDDVLVMGFKTEINKIISPMPCLKKE